VPYGEDARIVFETLGDDQVQGPGGRPREGEGWGAVAARSHADRVLDPAACAAQVFAQLLRAQAGQVLVVVAVAGDLVALAKQFAQKRCQMGHHPAQQEKRRPAAMISQQSRQPLDKRLGPLLQPQPVAARDAAGKNLTLEVFLNVN
jgi:hypothetical protein